MARKTKGELPSGSIRRQVFVGYEYIYDNNGELVLDDKGKPKKKRKYESFTAQSKKEAEFMASEYALNRKKKNKVNSSFGELLEEYIDVKQNVLSPSTLRGYGNIKGMLQKNYTWFYILPLCKISQEHLQKLANELAETKSPKTCRNYHGLVTAVLNHNGIDFSINTTLPQKEHPELYIPTDDEVRTLLQAVQNTELEIPVLLGAFCTMRRGEICGLSIEDLSDDNILHIHHSLVLGPDLQLHLKAPKTASSDRYIEIPSFIADKIRERGYITKIKPNTITKRLAILQDRYNLPHFRFHDLRHYSASIQHALGIPDAYIMQRGGWSSDTVLKSVYRHAMSDHTKRMTAIINNHFEGICNTKCNTKK